MSKYPAGRKTETRARILAAATRLLNERGAEGTSIETVMREAGLTVGGFYAHFPSKEGLIEEAMLAGLDHSLTRLVEGLDGVPPARFAATLIDRYLDQARHASLAAACPLTLHLADVARADDASRQRFAARTGTLVERIESRLPSVPEMAPRDAALALFAALAGAVSLARTAATSRGRERILAATRASLARWLGLPSDDAGGA